MATYDPNHLQNLHPVAEFDGRITLDEPTHVYYIKTASDNENSQDDQDGQATEVPCNFSVTTFVKQYFSEFNADEVIANMMRGASWGPKHKYWGRTPEDIKAEWSSNKAAEFGTEMHAVIEKFYNIPELYGIKDHRVSADELKPFYDAAETESPEFQQFLDWHFGFIVPRGWIPWRTELRVFDVELVLAGSIDMIFLDPVIDKRLHIVDWKRAKEIKTKSFYNRSKGYEKGRGPCYDLMDCNFVHYSLQVNTYAAILARNMFKSSGYTIGELYLAVFHPNYSSEYIRQLAVDEVRAKSKSAVDKDADKDAVKDADKDVAKDADKDSGARKKRKIVASEDDQVDKLMASSKYSKMPIGYQAVAVPNMLSYVSNMMADRLTSKNSSK